MKVKTSTVRFEKERPFNVEDLRLHIHNNRITHLEIKDEKELEDILWREGKLLPLYHDIMNRGMQEPLILFPNQFRVAEGNCRLVCLRKLHQEANKSGGCEDFPERIVILFDRMQCLRNNKQKKHDSSLGWSRHH